MFSHGSSKPFRLRWTDNPRRHCCPRCERLLRELIARYTNGEPLPHCAKVGVGLPAGHVVYVTAEDGVQTAWTHFDKLGANIPLISVLPAILNDGDMMNVLEHRDELAQLIRERGSRWVVIDGQNSVLGTPPIMTDMLARNNVTNPLHQFAQRHNICLTGIRNEDDEGRALGPQSMGDLARCILKSVKLGEVGDMTYFELQFVKVNDAPPNPPIPYAVRRPIREILWGKRMSPKLAEAMAKKATKAKALRRSKP
jgi:hypothetical protein